MRVVVAPDKFRGSLTAAEAAAAIATGLRRVRPSLDISVLPVADGGEGTIEAALGAGFTARTVTVRGPTSAPVHARFAVDGTTAVVEMAQASGLRRLADVPDVSVASRASSYGTGELVRAALDAGARRIVLGVGGSASTDGGAGLARALGVRFLDGAGHPIAEGGLGLLALRSIDLSGRDDRLAPVELVVATDVDNPLIGPQGAAHVYAPQKGADPATATRLDIGLRTLADVIETTTGRDVRDLAGMGAAGGIAASAVPLLGAVLASGIDILLELTSFADRVAGADLVVTGEGSLDAQTLRGKATHGVARVSARHHVPVIAVCGRLDVDAKALQRIGIRRAYSLADVEPDVERRMAYAAPLLSLLCERVAVDWLSGPGAPEAERTRITPR